MGPARPRPPADAIGRALPVRRPRRQPSRPLRIPRRGDRPYRPLAEGRPGGVVAGEPRLSRVDVQAAPGVKWHNVPPLNGRELVAADIKYCFEAYAKEGVQSFTFKEVEGIETPDKYTVRVHLQTPNVLFAHNLAEPITVMFPREVLEEDGDLKKRMIGTGPYILKEHSRKVRVVLARNPDYFDKGRPYVDEYIILSTPDAATRMAAVPHGAERHHLAGEPRRGRHGAEDQYHRRHAVVPQYAGAVRAGAGAGQAAVQRRAGAARHLDRHRPAEAGGHGLRRPRHPRLGRAVHLLPGHDADRRAARPVVAVSARGREEAPHRGRPSQRLLGDAVLLRVLPADDVADPARPAGPQAQPQHRRQDHQARLHDVLRALRRRKVGRHVLGIPVGPRGGRRRAHVPVLAFEVDEELLPGERSRHRRAVHQAAADAAMSRTSA